MSSVETAVRVVHVVFAGAWTGGTLLFAGAVLAAARRGLLDADALAWITRRFSHLSVASVVVLLVTGGHLAGTLYTFETLASTGRGHLVLSMTGLWVVLAGISHVGSRRLLTSLDADGPRVASTATRGWFLGAAGVSVALLVVAGAL